MDDNTTNTEDSAEELWLQIGGTFTKVLNIDALGVDSGTLKLLGTGGDFGDANVDNVGSIALDIIKADGSSITTSNDWTYVGSVTVNGANIAGDGATTITNVVNYSAGTQAGYTGTLTVYGLSGVGTNRLCFSGGVITNNVDLSP